MTGKSCLRGMGTVVLASLLLAPAAQATSWWSALGWGSSEASRLVEGVSALWERLTGIILPEEGENRGTIDPNG